MLLDVFAAMLRAYFLPLIVAALATYGLALFNLYVLPKFLQLGDLYSIYTLTVWRSGPFMFGAVFIATHFSRLYFQARGKIYQPELLVSLGLLILVLGANCWLVKS